MDKYNKDPSIHGILVQLPLPKHVNETKVLYAIDPDKDVDGFHPVNVGKLMIGEAVFLPCTPAGIQQMLIRSGVKTSGAEVVVVGRSNIVGKPIANMMIQKQEGANSTVTVCHTRTKNMKEHTLRGDILIVAAGVPKAVTADMVKDGAVVIDVGVNRIGKTESGKAILCGDVDFDACQGKGEHDHAGSGWCGPHDHHHADDEHRQGCEAGKRPIVKEGERKRQGERSMTSALTRRRLGPDADDTGSSQRLNIC